MKEDDWVVHHPTGVVDQIKYIWSGADDDVFVNPQGQRIEGKRVVELVSGNSFIDSGSEFAELTADELGFFLAARSAIDRFRKILVGQAATIPLRPNRVDLFLSSEFRRIASRQGP